MSARLWKTRTSSSSAWQRPTFETSIANDTANITIKGFGRIRSAGDEALFTKSTAAMKKKLGVKDSRPLADFLPTVTIAAKNLATEMTNHNTEEKDLRGEYSIKGEHVSNNKAVREMLTQRGIYPEKLPPAEDIKKLQRRVTSEEKKLAKAKGFQQTEKKP